MLPVGLGLLAWWGFLIARAWGNPHARLFWKGGSLLTLPDLFYRNIILGSQVLLAVPIAVRRLDARGGEPVLVRRGRSRSSRRPSSAWRPWHSAMVKPLVSPRGRDRPPRTAACRAIPASLPHSPAGHAGWKRLTWLALNLAAYLLVFGFAALFLIRFWTLRRLRPADPVLRPGRGPEHRAVAADAALLRLPRLRGVGVLPAQADAHRRAVPRPDARTRTASRSAACTRPTPPSATR